jgi:hypothetical protein
MAYQRHKNFDPANNICRPYRAKMPVARSCGNRSFSTLCPMRYPLCSSPRKYRKKSVEKWAAMDGSVSNVETVGLLFSCMNAVLDAIGPTS